MSAISVGKIIFSALMLSLIGVLLAFWYLINEPAPQVDAVRTVLTPVVKAGETFRYTNAFVNKKRCGAIIYRSAFDGQDIRVYSDYEERPAFDGDDDSKETVAHTIRAIPIPKDATPGTAHFETQYRWVCNPLQRIFPQVFNFNSLTFTIVQ